MTRVQGETLCTPKSGDSAHAWFSEASAICDSPAAHQHVSADNFGNHNVDVVARKTPLLFQFHFYIGAINHVFLLFTFFEEHPSLAYTVLCRTSERESFGASLECS
jgi:hypothetical protein